MSYRDHRPLVYELIKASILTCGGSARNLDVDVVKTAGVVLG
jgi:hypothetical protein